MSAYTDQLRYRAFVCFHQSTFAFLSSGMAQQTLGALTALGLLSTKAAIVDVIQRHVPAIYTRFGTDLGLTASLNPAIFTSTRSSPPPTPDAHWQRMVGRNPAVLAAPTEGRTKGIMSGSPVYLYTGGEPLNTRRVYGTQQSWRGPIDGVRRTIPFGPIPSNLFVAESNLRELGFDSFADQVAALHDELLLWNPAVLSAGDYEFDPATETVLGSQYTNKRYQDFDNHLNPIGPIVPF